MQNNLYQNKYRISTTRASWHNYNGGMYFVTICTKGREHYFGKIVNEMGTTEPTMILSEIGHYTDEQFRNVHEHYPYAEIPLWVVMPNHVHAVVIIDGKKEPHNDNRIAVETLRATSPQQYATSPQQRATSIQGKNEQMSRISPKSGTLATIIRGLKSAVTCYANQHHIPFAWQPRFHEHIIRNTDDMNTIAEYIENNVAQWECDRFYG